MTVKVIDESEPISQPAAGMSDLAQLRKDAENYAPKPLRYVHPTLPQYILIFRHDLDGEQMEAWRKKCIILKARPGREAEIDATKFNRMVVAGTSLGIEMRDNLTEMTGRPMTDSKDDEVSFTNREFISQFNVATAADAVKAFILSDPAIAALANKIVEDNGVGGDVEALPDPTDGDGN